MNASPHHSSPSGLLESELSSPRPTKRKRAPVGKGDCCRTCRLRKVRCAGNPGDGEACTNCSRLELDCGFKDASNTPDVLDNIARTTPSNSHTEAGTLRKRAQRACAQCHAQKTRCSGDLPTCKRCVDQGFVCEYTRTKRRKSAAVSSDGVNGHKPVEAIEATDERGRESLESAVKSGPVFVVEKRTEVKEQGEPCFVNMEELVKGQTLALKDLLKQHFNAYLEFYYYLPCISFLHPATTLQAIEDGTIAPPLAAALCAATSPFLGTGRATQDFGARCMDQVELHIWRTYDSFSEDVLILVAFGLAYDFYTGSLAKAWQSIGVAVRLMLALQTNWDTSPGSTDKGAESEVFVKQETTRRLAWCIFAFDRVLAGGYDEYVSCRRENMKIRLPCDDQAFLDGVPASQPPRLDEKTSKAMSNCGLAGFGVLIIDLRHQVQVYSRTLAGQLGPPMTKREPSSIMSSINNFQNALSQLHASLPPNLRLSQQSIASHMALPARTGFVYFHTHFFATHIDLYRFALPGFHHKSRLMRLPRDFFEKSQRQAISYAICLAKFCEDIMKESEGLFGTKGGARSTMDRLRMHGDATIFLMATQALRVLLVALQHRLYEGLDLAEHSTVPLWRHGPTTGPQIRGLIDTLLKIGEPWAEVIVTARHAHERNRAMVEHFDKTHRFTDQPGTLNHSTANLGGHGFLKLPGPHYILDEKVLDDAAKERRARTHDAAAQSWSASASNGVRLGGIDGKGLRRGDDMRPSHIPLLEATHAPGIGFPVTTLAPEAMGMGPFYGPPGVPTILAQARGVDANLVEAGMYGPNDLADTLQDDILWPIPDFSMMAGTGQQQQQQQQPQDGELALTQQFQHGVMAEVPPSMWSSVLPSMGATYLPTAGAQGMFAGEQQFADGGPFSL